MRELLLESCGDCHLGEDGEGGFSLDEFDDPASVSEDHRRWLEVGERIADRSMPPSDAEPLSAPDYLQLTEWIQASVREAVCAEGPQAGPPLIRRLTRHEYANSVRDLLQVHFNAAEGLPEDSSGGEGFSNASETLMISPVHAEKFLDAARRALQYAARDSASRKVLFASIPASNRSENVAATENLRRLAERAYRRPVDKPEVDRLVSVYSSARDDGLPYEQALLYAMRGVLVSPHFLFIAEQPARQPGEAELLTPHELATRLSYFLWATMPDKELRRAADDGTLNNPEVLRTQVRRLLEHDSTHLRDSIDSFIGQWLGTADLGSAKKVDRQRHSWVEEPHTAAMRNQPVYDFETILRENLSVLEIIDASWTHLNRFLLKFYGFNKKAVESKIDGNLRRAELPDDYRYRGGLLASAGVLAVSSYPRRSSPVLRGAWVLETLLGIELPPPPPDVPALDEDEAKTRPLTLRQRLERHRADAACASCHDRIDPIGFALEHFDEIGRWRDEDEGGPINAVATLPSGTRLDGLQGLKAYLLERRDDVARQLTRKLLGYALGRGLTVNDECTVDAILQRLRDNDYRSHELILGIVESRPFQMKR